MEATLIVLLALVQYLVFTGQAGMARARGKVEAPACSGDETFERRFRVQQNTLEQLVVFVPGMLIFANVASAAWAVVPGVVFLVGRALYARAYVRDPKRRGPGMVLTFLANATLVGGALVAVLSALLRG